MCIGIWTAKYSLQKELSQAIEASLKEMDPNVIWTKDNINHHTMPPPDYDSDEEVCWSTDL